MDTVLLLSPQSTGSICRSCFSIQDTFLVFTLLKMERNYNWHNLWLLTSRVILCRAFFSSLFPHLPPNPNWEARRELKTIWKAKNLILLRKTLLLPGNNAQTRKSKGKVKATRLPSTSSSKMQLPERSQGLTHQWFSIERSLPQAFNRP